MLLWFTSESRNQYTLRTGSGSDCVLVIETNSTTKSDDPLFLGIALSTECTISKGQTAGCSILDSKYTSFGQGFNTARGGVFAHRWDSAGLAIWHFERDVIPQDIQKGHPDPSSWPIPVAFWSSLGCDFSSHLSSITLSSTPRSAVGGQAVITRILGAPQLPLTKSPKGRTSSVCFCMFLAYRAVLIERPDAKWVINYIAVYE
jgi:hypothetical protein